MLKIGNYNKLSVIRKKNGGLLLNGDDSEIYIPKKYAPKNAKEGDTLNVFVYNDSKDTLKATTQIPKAVAGEYAYLKVKSVTEIGAFMDWGIDKDLFVPVHAQAVPMQEGKQYTVKVIIDYKGTGVIGISKFIPFINTDTSELTEGEKVRLFVYEFTNLGIAVIINNEYTGLLYYNETFEKLSVGDCTEGFIKQIREDGKVDVSLQQQGYIAIVQDKKDYILDALKKAGGFLPFHDKSNYTEIRETFKMSKKTFKKAIGALYKEDKLTITEKGIKLK